MYRVFLGEADGKWPLNGVKVCKKVVDEGRTAGASEEENCFGIFLDEGFALGKFPLRAGVFGFADVIAFSNFCPFTKSQS